MIRMLVVISAVVCTPALLPAMTPVNLEEGRAFLPVDFTDPVGTYRKREALPRGQLQPRPRFAPPGPDSPDIVVIEGDRCSTGCIIGDPFVDQGLVFFDINPDLAVQRVYEQVGDDYDVVVMWTTFHTWYFGGAAYAPVANDVLGINGDMSGQVPETYNFGPQLYGGTRMRGIVLMQDWFQCDFWNDLAGGNFCTLEPPFEESFFSPYATLAQEIGHQWGSFVEINTAAPTALLGRDQSHWSYLLHSGASPMEGNSWRDNGNGSFAAQGPLSVTYSPLDLYLMGLLPSQDVGTLWYIANSSPAVSPGEAPWPYGNGPQSVSGTRTDLTVDDVIAREGTRSPSSQTSPKLHRELWFLVHLPIDNSDPDSQYTDTSARVQKHISDLDAMRAHWNEMFYRITGERMRAITTQSVRDDYPTWSFTAYAEGWQSSDAATGTLSNQGGSLVLSATADGAGVQNRAVKVDTLRYDSVEIVLRSDPSASGPAAFHWETAPGAGFEPSVPIPVVHDGNTATYRAALAGHAAWRGVVSGLRFVPAAQVIGSTNFAVDSIRLFDDPAVQVTPPSTSASPRRSSAGEGGCSCDSTMAASWFYMALLGALRWRRSRRKSPGSQQGLRPYPSSRNSSPLTAPRSWR